MSDEPDVIASRTTSPPRSAFTSDTLRQTLELAENLPALRPIVGELITFLVVLDASAVQGELRWRVASRKNPNARSSLHELIESGVVTAAAPTYLKTEIEEQLPRIALESSISLETVALEWTRFESLLKYYLPTDGRPKTACPDPDDLPYFLVSEQIAADFVWTRDQHFAATQAPNMASGLDTSLRDYARATSIMAGVKITSGVAVVCSVEALMALVTSLIEAIRKIPPALKLCLALAFVGLFLHPKSREWILERLKAILSFAERARPVVVSLTRTVFSEFSSAALTAATTEARIRMELPVTQRVHVPAIAMIRRVCLKASKPLPLAEIEERVRAAGYKTRSRSFRPYLKRILRDHSEFAEASPGFWILKTASGA